MLELSYNEHQYIQTLYLESKQKINLKWKSFEIYLAEVTLV